MAPIALLSLRSFTSSSSSSSSSSHSSDGSISAIRKRLLVRLASSIPLPPSLLRSSLVRRALSKSYPPSLEERQTIAIIPTSYQIQGPPPGTVVGIVLGSVAGFLLLILLLWLLTNGNMFGGNGEIEGDVEEVVVRRRSRSPRSSHRRSRRSQSIREVRQVSRSPRPSRTIVEERIVRDAAPPPPRPGSIIVEERRETMRESDRREGDDIVEVIEEHSDIRSPVSPPRVSRRDSDRRRSRRSSGYRSVDPNLYAGGNYPQHPMRRRDSISDVS